jgi:hypothetical protein
MRDVLGHGAVYATWADTDQGVEVRQRTATFDFDGDVIVIDDGITQHRIAMAHLLSWEKPMNVYEDHG